MLSPDVPEFVPRSYQTPDSTNTVNCKPEETTSQPQQTKPPPTTHEPPSHARSDPSVVTERSHLQREREKIHGKQNGTWRQPRHVFDNQRESQPHEINRHESGFEAPQGNDSSTPKEKLSQKHTSQISKGRPKRVNKNLESHIRFKFVPTTPTFSYTKILKSEQPAKSIHEAESSKQQDILSTEDHWPTLGESLPLYKMPERASEPPAPEKTSNNPWLSRGNEGSPMKSPVKNPWKGRATAQQTADSSIKPRNTGTSSPTKNPGNTSNNPWLSRGNEGSHMKSPVKNPWQDRATVQQTADSSIKPRNTGTSPPIKNPLQERGTAERSGDASVRPKSTEKSSPVKRSTKDPANPWQKRTTVERIVGDSLRPRISNGNSKMNLENDVKTKPAPHTQQKKVETNDDNSLESKGLHLPKNESNKHDKESNSQKSYARTTMNTELKNRQGEQSEEAAALASKNTITQDDADLFQWKVIGEKKKRVKFKPQVEEINNSSQLQALLRGDNKYGRVLPDKPSQNDRAKENQGHTSSSKTRNVLDLSESKTKGIISPSPQETQNAIKKAAIGPKASWKERKKSKLTKVTSLANYSNDKKETRPYPKTATSTVATAAQHPDGIATEKKLAMRLKRQEEKRKLKEMKAREALMRPKDTKVSLVSTNFLQKTQTPSKASRQPSSQTTTSAERIRFTFDEYPALQNRQAPQTLPSNAPHTDTQQDTSPYPPSDKDDLQISSDLSTNTSISKLKPTLKVTKKSPSIKGRLQADDLLASLLPPDASLSDDDLDVSKECAATTYRTALLSAKEKETKLYHEHNMVTTNYPDSPINTTPEKKKVRTRDPIELDLFALAAMSGKNKKKESAENLSPAKRKIYEEKKEDGLFGRKMGGGTQPKGAVVLAKRGKINAKKPKKKKLSRVQKCKIERRQRELLAMQLLLERGKAIQQQQQELLEPSPPTYKGTEGDTEAQGLEGGSDTNELFNTVTNTEADKEKEESRSDVKEDTGKQKHVQEKSEGETEDCNENKESERPHESPDASLNINSQGMNTLAEGDDSKPKLMCKIEGTQYPITENVTPGPEENSNSAVKDENTDEGNASSQHSTEDEPKSSQSPSQQNLLTDDPLIAEKASELIQRIKTQNKPKGPREYCHQVVTPEVDCVAKNLIRSLITFQKRQYQRDPVKARIRKRYVFGLKETTKLMGKMSCVIMAPNIEQCEGPGSLDDAVEKLLNQAEKLKVPVVFALSTNVMKSFCSKYCRKVSCVGIINYHGAQDLFHQMMELLPEAQKQYQQLVASGQCTLPKEGEEEEEEEEGKGESPKKDLNTEIVARTSTLLMVP